MLQDLRLTPVRLEHRRRAHHPLRPAEQLEVEQPLLPRDPLRRLHQPPRRPPPQPRPPNRPPSPLALYMIAIRRPSAANPSLSTSGPAVASSSPRSTCSASSITNLTATAPRRPPRPPPPPPYPAAHPSAS